MIVLIGIEGTLGDANDPTSGYAGSFIHKLVRDWPDQPCARYIPGPAPPTLSWRSHADTQERAERAVAQVLALRGRADVTGVFLAGYSLGGASAIAAARRLGEMNIPVDCLVLIDAIDVAPPVVRDGGVPANVRYMVHGYRAWGANSRPLWGNCGTRSPNRYEAQQFFLTHWGASGVPLHEGIPSGVRSSDLVTEYDYWTESDRVTNVTWGLEIAKSALLWKWLKRRVEVAFYKAGGSAITHAVVQGESLSLIAQQYYGDPLLWLILYDSNLNVIDDPNRIEPGMRLRVPVVNTFTPEELDQIREAGRNWKDW